jgi:hypothetical protein
MRNLILTPLLAALFLTACSSGQPHGLPGGATLMKEGGGPLTYTATDRGTLYLRDQPADHIVFETTVTPGQRLDVDPAANRVTLDGRAVDLRHALRADGTYQVFLKTGEQREYHPAMNP